MNLLIPLLLLQMGNLAQVQIKTTKVAGSTWMLEGSGGNIGVTAGPDGVFLIDDQFAPLAPKIQAAIAQISKRPLRFIFNTHWHGDHTGGNEALAGTGALIVAHDNVRKRMSHDQRSDLAKAFGRPETIPASPAKALPVITFSEEVTFHLNEDEIHVVHVAAAHTDGDAIIHFTRANVLHAGDVFINGGYPIIDLSSGGTIDGYIAAQERLLALVDEHTKIIPGHGPLGDRAALKRTHDMIVAARAAIAKAAQGGKRSLEEVIAAKPTAPWDAEWASLIKPDLFVTMVYKTLPSSASKTRR
jgi:glyoxylase-like metal-dependent hydrolase (beta-lactamase superfamily II)